ncbi:hypothetical protein BDY17DRAFT_41342 [Neohortaea acidophila]|uniref:Uncharacterized protein n=1 Tax=Neohortaea acidophila TaxID=245834 RepID=A0A6A6PIL4_9PEZI|nr:uncharacterized protein BDY17DRAFT_41342 [Neohortaea acidophila]KAF2479554.1 hypothetical protein BDY17DRAFT_41342 [Neohortaea acidophila]
MPTPYKLGTGYVNVPPSIPEHQPPYPGSTGSFSLQKAPANDFRKDSADVEPTNSTQIRFRQPPDQSLPPATSIPKHWAMIKASQGLKSTSTTQFCAFHMVTSILGTTHSVAVNLRELLASV